MALPKRHVDLVHLESVDHGDDLIEQHIVPHPLKRGRAFARLRESGYPVALVIGFLDSVNGDVEETASNFKLSEAEIMAAIAFYRRHKAYIDAVNLIDNDVDWPEP